MQGVTLDPNFYVRSYNHINNNGVRLSVDERKVQLAIHYKNIFQLTLGIIISLILMLCFSSQAVICVFENNIEFLSIVIKTNLFMQIIVQSCVGLLYLYFSCIISRFVRNYLPNGMVAESSVKKMKALFITIFIGIFIRTSLIWLLVFDVINRFDKHLSDFAY